MKFRVLEDLESTLRTHYSDYVYGDADLEDIYALAYNNYSDAELWEAFKDVAWPTFSHKEKEEFLRGFEEPYKSILEVPVEEGMEDRSWIVDALDEVNFFDDDYDYFADKYFSTEDYADNLRDYQEYDDARRGIGLGV